MLAASQVAAQLPGVVAELHGRLAKLFPALEKAQSALSGWSAAPASTDEAIRAAMAGSPRPFALSLEAPMAEGHAAPPFEPCVVVAADGSSIPVDRYAPAPCYVVNTGRVALPYGLPGEANLDSEARVGPSDESPDPDVSTGGLDLLRDVLELEAATELAVDRAEAGSVVALLDGTLLPWDLDSTSVDPAVRAVLQERTRGALNTFRVVPERPLLAAYVSASRAADVSTSLVCLAGEGERPHLNDAMLFREILADGERSSVFRAWSERARRVESLFSAGDQVCFFYLRWRDEIARLELPAWAATSPLVERLHATLVDQLRRGRGYPRALQEAHECAVISEPDREFFSRLLERVSRRAGIRTGLYGKAASKRRRMV